MTGQGVSRETPLAPDACKRLIAADDVTMTRLAAYVDLLRTWCRRINLVGARTLDDPWRRHILDCAQLASHLPGGRPVVVDLGTGAGLPGLIVAILTDAEVHLVESNARKCAFLQEAARITQTQVAVHHDRIETFLLNGVDCVTARACAPLSKLLEYAESFLASDGTCLFLKGAAAEAELTACEKQWKMAVSLIESRSDRSGRIVKIEGLQRCGGQC